MVRRRITNKKGFTLIELMTTVAIIGTLAAVGVPQYRKFQRKAKRAEANVILGAISSANSAFLAEYNTYGSVLAGIGMDLEAQPQTYVCGFTDAGGEQAAFPAAAPTALPGYLNMNFVPALAAGYNAGGRRVTSVASGAGAAGYSSNGVVNGNDTASMTLEASFRANCIGNLRAGAAAVGTNDIITINNTRTVVIAQDGT